MFRHLICFEIVATGAAASSPLLPIHLRQKPTGEQAFVDSDGRERLFRGTNAITKGPPWVPDTRSYSSDLSMVAQDFEQIASMGMNVLRLGAMWSGIEPVRGQYNETYLAQLKKIVDGAAQYGIYTLLDMHQDGLSEFFCGEGIPTWAVRQTREWEFRSGGLFAFPAPYSRLNNETDYYIDATYWGAPRLPTRNACATHNCGIAGSWCDGTMQAANAFEALYTNVNGTGDAWAAMWATVAEYFKGVPSVLGLELINEPMAGDIFSDPLLLLPYPSPTSADRTRLQPAYDRINAAVRRVDDEALLFFAGVTWGDFGPGFTAAPGGDDYANRSVLAYHYYHPPQLGTTEDVVAQLAAARRLSTGIFLTETCGGKTHNVTLAQAADAHLQSSAYWEYKSFCREDAATRAGASQNGVWGACKTGVGPSPGNWRTFAKAVAGVTHSMAFNDTTKNFRLAFSVDLSCRLPTEVAISPAQNYPHGFVATVEPAGALRVTHNASDDPYTLYVEPTDAVRHGQNVSLRLAPKLNASAKAALVEA